MRIARFFIDPPLEASLRLALPERAAHHATRVLRLRVGDAVTLFDGRGGEYGASITEIRGEAVSVEVGPWQDVEREAPFAIVLAQGLSSAERMDLTVQKAVELGVATIQPLSSEKSVVRLDARRTASRLAHWRRIVLAACEQCGRNRPPEVRAPLSVAALCQEPGTPAAKWLLAPDATTRVRDVAGGLDAGLIMAAGPEAGFSEAETRALLVAGYMPVQLGPRILRTETAALAAIAAVNAIAGDG